MPAGLNAQPVSMLIHLKVFNLIPARIPSSKKHFLSLVIDYFADNVFSAHAFNTRLSFSRLIPAFNLTCRSGGRPENQL